MREAIAEFDGKKIIIKKQENGEEETFELKVLSVEDERKVKGEHYDIYKKTNHIIKKRSKKSNR